MLPCLSHTDLCSGVDLPEVEIVSLLTEKLPRYTLRADHVFGYDHDDWLHTPLLPPEAALGLTYEQIDETFKYFCKSHTLQNLLRFLFFLLNHCLRVTPVQLSVSSVNSRALCLALYVIYVIYTFLVLSIYITVFVFIYVF